MNWVKLEDNNWINLDNVDRLLTSNNGKDHRICFISGDKFEINNSDFEMIKRKILMDRTDS